MANVSSSNSLGERVPKLRFPEFEGEWDSSTMGELGTFTKGASLSKCDITENGTPLILYGELYTTYGDIATTIVRKTDKNVKSECYSILGDVIIPTSGESPEEISTCTCVMQDGVILAGDLNIYRTNDVDGRFLSYEINHIRNREIAKIAQGKSIVHIKADELEKIVIRFPSKTEQSKIIELFSCLDRRIELQKKLIESLKLYKRGLLSKLFPQKDENVPQYRFEGFIDAWEQRKFSNIIIEKLTNGVMNQQSESQTNVRHINVINMYASDRIHVEDLTYSSCNNIAIEKCNVEIGDIFLTRSSLKPEGIAEPNVLLDYGCFVFDDHLIRMKVDKEKYDPLFTKILLSTKLVKKQFIAKSKQNAFTTIGQEDIAGSEGSFPSLNEQQEIGEYFSNIDTLITLHQKKHDFYEKQKLALLQQMFI